MIQWLLPLRLLLFCIFILLLTSRYFYILLTIALDFITSHWPPEWIITTWCVYAVHCAVLFGRKMKEIEPARDYLYRMNNCVNFGSHFIMSVVQLSFFANVFWFFILFYLRVCVFFCAAVVELFLCSIFHLLYDFLSLGYKMWIGQNLCFIRILFASNNILRNERLFCLWRVSFIITIIIIILVVLLAQVPFFINSAVFFLIIFGCSKTFISI